MTPLRPSSPVPPKRRALLAALVLMAAATAAGPGRVSAASKWDRYKPDTLQHVVDTALANTDKEPGLMTAFGSDYATVARVIYVGQRRPIPSDRAAVLSMAARASGIEQDLSRIFSSEILVKEGERQFWIPVQDVLLSSYDEEMKPGDLMDLYVILIGVNRDPKGTIDPLFLSNEFRRKA